MSSLLPYNIHFLFPCISSLIWHNSFSLDYFVPLLKEIQFLLASYPSVNIFRLSRTHFPCRLTYMCSWFSSYFFILKVLDCCFFLFFLLGLVLILLFCVFVTYLNCCIYANPNSFCFSSKSVNVISWVWDLAHFHQFPCSIIHMFTLFSSIFNGTILSQKRFVIPLIRPLYPSLVSKQ